MALVLDDRVRETSTTTGTGTLNLDGAVGGFQTFVAGVGNSNTTYYAIVHRSETEWEIGVGTVTDASTDTLARTTVISSSNSDSAVSFSAGTKDVFVTQPASKAVYEDAGADVTLPDDLILGSDSAVLKFGADSDTTLTHTDGTGLTLNSTNKLCFNDASEFIHSSGNAVLSIGATSEIDLTASTIQVNGTADINGAADVSGNLTVGGNTTITGNLTVNGTATSIATTNVTTGDNIITLNNDVTSGSPSENAGIEVRRGGSDTVALRWNESTDKWQITNDGSSYNDIATTATTHSAVTLDNQGLGLLSLNGQLITVNDVMLRKHGGGTLDVSETDNSENLTITGVGGNSGTTALAITGGTSASSNAAVSITGHLEATTKSFNIPHPLLEHKRLVYGSLEGPEHGMYARGSFDVEDERRKVAIDLPMYWSKMVHHDYTVNLTTYGDYNVWITERDENGFWVETNAEKEWSFDWNAIGGRKDAKLVVEPDA